ncbi:MAG: ferritin-like domain-containing protein [bacterium]
MGKRGREITGLDVDKLIEKLNKALADEWLAYYQYWIGAKIVNGPLRGDAEAELLEHSQDELRHAEMIADRIDQLGGTPVLEPKQWYEITNCGYEVPKDPYIEEILKQNIKGEQCAIDVYKELVDYTEGKDQITYNIALEIMRDEVEHEDDLEAILEDLNIERDKMRS